MDEEYEDEEEPLIQLCPGGQVVWFCSEDDQDHGGGSWNGDDHENKNCELVVVDCSDPRAYFEDFARLPQNYYFCRLT